MPPRQGHSFALLTFFCAIVLAGVILLVARNERLRTQTVKNALTPHEEVAVEHDASLTLHVDGTAGKDRGIVEFTAEGTGMLALSLPARWERREVRGGPLSAVTMDQQAMGFAHWKLPTGVTASFWTIGSPSLLIKNVSTAPLLIMGKRVDVKTGRVEEKSIVVKDGSARLW